MKKLIEGLELRSEVPETAASGEGLCAELACGLSLDDHNFYRFPCAILGGVGTGKTRLTKQLLEPVLERARLAGDNVVIFAAKPDLMRYARPGDIVIRVDQSQPNAEWNLFLDMEASGDPELTSRELSAALFQEARDRTNQIFFPDAARDCFHNTAMYLYNYGKENGIRMTNGDLVEFLTTTPVHGSEDSPGWIELARDCPEYFGMMRDYLGNGTEQGMGVLSELRTQIFTTFFRSFASCEGTFSAVEAIRSGGRVIFLHYDYAKASSSAMRIFKIILDLMMKQSLSGENLHKTYFFLDEFALLPKLEHLQTCLSYGRDPSDREIGGCRVLVTLQSARVLSRHYGEEEALTLLSLFPNIISLQVMDSMSRRLLADRYGESRYQYSYTVPGGKPQHIDCLEHVVSDYHYGQLTKPGQAIMSLPFICNEPFFYDGYRKEQML